MVGDEQQLPQVRLPGPMRNAREEVHILVQSQRRQRLLVLPEGRDAPGHRACRGPDRFLGPIVLRPARLGVAGVPAEVEDVALRQSQVLQELPERIGQPGSRRAPLVGRDAVHDLVYPGVRVFPPNQGRHLIAERLVAHGAG